MSDNTTTAASTGGDTIRTIDRSGDSVPIAAKTQVIALDVGGESNESLLVGVAKGTQGSILVPVQLAQDAGRNARIFILDTYTAAPVAEALQSVVQWYGNAAVAATTTPAVVATGKTLRLTNWQMMYSSLSTVGHAVLRIRCNTSGVAVLASPLVWEDFVGSIAGATTTAMTGGFCGDSGAFPEGLEFPSGAGLGFTLAGYGPTGTLTLEGGVRFVVCGFEY